MTYYQEGDYAAALAEFKRANEIAPSWRVLFNIGQAYFQLHEYVDALTTLQRFIAEGGDQIKPKRRADVEAELADLTNRVGYVVIESNLADTAVSIDDRPIGNTPFDHAIAVSAGLRRITAQHAERDPQERRASVVGGETTHVQLDFPPPTAPVSDVTFVPSPSPPAPARRPNRVPAVAAFGVGAAGLAAAAIAGGLAWIDKSKLDATCSARSACPVSSQPLISAMRRDALIANVALGVAAVGAITGTTLWFTVGPRPAAPGPSSDVLLEIGPGILRGTF